MLPLLGCVTAFLPPAGRLLGNLAISSVGMRSARATHGRNRNHLGHTLAPPTQAIVSPSMMQRRSWPPSCWCVVSWLVASASASSQSPRRAALTILDPVHRDGRPVIGEQISMADDFHPAWHEMPDHHLLVLGRWVEEGPPILPLSPSLIGHSRDLAGLAAQSQISVLA